MSFLINSSFASSVKTFLSSLWLYLQDSSRLSPSYLPNLLLLSAFFLTCEADVEDFSRFTQMLVRCLGVWFSTMDSNWGTWWGPHSEWPGLCLLVGLCLCLTVWPCSVTVCILIIPEVFSVLYSYLGIHPSSTALVDFFEGPFHVLHQS